MKIEQPLVSVVVVSYNAELTIAETLESIVNQTYKNIEIIIADDCSTDSTLSVVEQFPFGNVKNKLVVTDKNTGVAANANNGIRAANGEYIKLIAADDILFENAIEVFLEHYNDAAITVSDCKMFGKNADKVRRLQDFYDGKNDFYLLNSHDQYIWLLKNNPIIAPAVGLIKKEFYLQLNGFDEQYPFCEDYPFWLKSMDAGKKFCHIPFVLVGYRISDTSLNGASSKGKLFYSDRRFFYKYRLLKLLRYGRFLDCIKAIRHFM